MGQKITIVGLGSIGGFLSAYIGKYIAPEQLNLIDPEHVDKKNIYNSIYSEENIGDLKTHVIHDLIKRENKKIKINRLPYDFNFLDKDIYADSDIIIDCRDVFDKNEIFDIKIYISENFLIIDGKKENLKNPICKRGSYTIEKDALEIERAVLIAVNLFRNGRIESVIENEKILRFDLNVYEKKFNEIISIDDDIIYENSEIEIKNLNDCVTSIFDGNKRKKVKIETIDKIRNYPINYFKNIDNFISEIKKIENKSLIKRFILDVEEKKDHIYISLIPEWGSA